MPKKNCILTLCAHNDDQLIGVGGTIRKTVDEGGIAHTYIFSYGAMSHPHLKPEIIEKTREKETHRAAKILGDQVHFLGLTEGKFKEEADRKEIESIIKKIKPDKIFTHSPDDPHPDHQAVLSVVKEVLKKMKYKGDVYAFDVWTPFTLRTRHYPKLFVDISNTFKTKIEAFKKHKSQFNTVVILGWSIYVKAILAGWNNQCKYAETFHKLDVKSM